MSAGKLDLYIEQGATFKAQLLWKDSLDTAIDLSGYTARLQIRPKIASDVLYVDMTTENSKIVLGGVAGTIDLSISAAETEAITWLTAKYDLELIDGTGFVTRLVEGIVKVAFNVTKPQPAVVLPPYLNQSYWNSALLAWDGTSWIKDSNPIVELIEANDWNINFRPASIVINYTITTEGDAGTVFDVKDIANNTIGTTTVDNVPGSYEATIPLTFVGIDLHKIIIGAVGYTDDMTIDNITFVLP